LRGLWLALHEFQSICLLVNIAVTLGKIGVARA
jgi:hypothetical protein